MNPAHYDYETLADLAEGLLEDDMAASVSEHLDACAECRERSADLADVSRLLAEAPVPSMPAELASRIDSAIAAESMNAATAVSLERGRGRRHWRILSAAAATVIVLGGGGLVAMLGQGGPGDHQSATNAPVLDNTDNTGGGHGESSGTAAKPSRSTMIGPQGEAPAHTDYKVARTGTDYRGTTLDRQVGGVLDDGAQLRSADRPPDRALAECVERIARGKAPTLVDAATYEGAPATVIAAPGAAPNTVDIWVVGPDCSLKHRTTAPRSPR